MPRKIRAKPDKAKTEHKKEAATRVAAPAAPSQATPAEQGQKKLTPEMEKIRKEKLKLAERFKDEIIKRYGKFVKAVVVFGSLVRGDFHAKSDIDMLVIIDDVLTRFSPEQKENFDITIQDIGKHISEDISVQPAWTLSEFWDMARIGHPLLYTIVRDGWALYDTGFFIPVRKLLELGKIPATLEAVERFMEGAPQKIQRVESIKLMMIAEDLYYAMLNSSQAVLMYLGENPPTPRETVAAVKEHLVDQKLLEQEYLDALNKVVEFRKGVEHKDIKAITGAELDVFVESAKRYVERMEQLLARLQEKRKESIVEKNYEVMIKAAVAALKKMDVLPPDPKDLPEAIKKHLIDTGRIDPYFVDVFRKVVGMRKALDEAKVKEIPQREIELMREYVRRFVREIEPIFAEKPKPAKKGK
ncbi:MAG: nucleotidyltransferase domain-containing protein [Candidatus Aenigmatarchaeota archaeon]